MGPIIAKSKSSKVRTHVVNVKSYGAKLDGTTNDAPAIQRAIDSISKGIVIIPAGTCILDATLVLKSDVTLEGAGIDSTILVFSGLTHDQAQSKNWFDASFEKGVDIMNAKYRSEFVCIGLNEGANDHPYGENVKIKNLTILPEVGVSTTNSGILGIYGNFANSSLSNVRVSFVEEGIFGEVNGFSITGASKLINCTYGLKLEEAKKLTILKCSVEDSIVGLKLPANSSNIVLQSVDFDNNSVAAMVGANSRAIAIISPSLEGVPTNPWAFDPTAEVQFFGDTTTSSFIGKVTSPKETLRDQRPINIVRDGLMQESNYLGTPWTISYDSKGPSDNTPYIRKNFNPKLNDAYLANDLFEGNRRLYVEPFDANGVVIQTTAQSLGYLDFEFSARNTQQVKVHIENADGILTYDSGWQTGSLTSGLSEKVPPVKLTGSAFKNEDLYGVDGPYTVKVLSSGTSPFYINKLAIYEGYQLLSEEDGATLEPTIVTYKGFQVYDWVETVSDTDTILFDTNKVANDHGKILVGFWAKAASVTEKGPWKLRISSSNEDGYTYTKFDHTAALYDTGEYQYFEFILGVEEYLTLQKPGGVNLKIAGLGLAYLYDTRDNSIVMDDVPTIGWWPLGSTVLNSAVTSGVSWGWTCVDNTTFPNSFNQNQGADFQYTWSGTYFGVKNSYEAEYTYTDLAGPSIEYMWSGTALGVRQEGSEDPFTYTELAGISGLQGDQGIQGVQGIAGSGLQFVWSGGTNLGIKYEGQDDSEYEFVNLIGATGATGATGPIGPIGPSGIAGASGVQGPQGESLLFLWSGTSLGVKGADDEEYTYTDLGGISGIQGIQGETGDSLDYIWNGTELGIRVNVEGELYEYTDLKGDTGDTGAAGDSAVYGKIWTYNGVSSTFVRQADGSYGHSNVIFLCQFVKDGITVGIGHVEITLEKGVPVYLYHNTPGYVTYTYTLGADNKTGTILFTYDDSADGGTDTCVVSDTVQVIYDGLDGSDGADGNSLAFEWVDTSLGIKMSGGTSYEYTDLIGPAGATGDTGPAGDAGPGLEYVWNGSQLGVKISGAASYEYTDLIGPAGTVSGVYSGRLEYYTTPKTGLKGTETIYASGVFYEANGLTSAYATVLVASVPSGKGLWALVDSVGGVAVSGSISQAVFTSDPITIYMESSGVVVTETFTFAPSDAFISSGIFKPEDYVPTAKEDFFRTNITLSGLNYTTLAAAQTDFPNCWWLTSGNFGDMSLDTCVLQEAYEAAVTYWQNNLSGDETEVEAKPTLNINPGIYYITPGYLSFWGRVNINAAQGAIFKGIECSGLGTAPDPLWLSEQYPTPDTNPAKAILEIGYRVDSEMVSLNPRSQNPDYYPTSWKPYVCQSVEFNLPQIKSDYAPVTNDSVYAYQWGGTGLRINGMQKCKVRNISIEGRLFYGVMWHAAMVGNYFNEYEITNVNNVHTFFKFRAVNGPLPSPGSSDSGFITTNYFKGGQCSVSNWRYGVSDWNPYDGAYDSVHFDYRNTEGTNYNPVLPAGFEFGEIGHHEWKYVHCETNIIHHFGLYNEVKRISYDNMRMEGWDRADAWDADGKVTPKNSGIVMWNGCAIHFTGLGHSTKPPTVVNLGSYWSTDYSYCTFERQGYLDNYRPQQAQNFEHELIEPGAGVIMTSDDDMKRFRVHMVSSGGVYTLAQTELHKAAFRVTVSGNPSYQDYDTITNGMITVSGPATFYIADASQYAGQEGVISINIYGYKDNEYKTLATIPGGSYLSDYASTASGQYFTTTLTDSGVYNIRAVIRNKAKFTGPSYMDTAYDEDAIRII